MVDKTPEKSGEDVLAACVDWLRTNACADLVLVFGSVASGRATAVSDLDLAFHSQGSLDPVRVAEMAQSLGLIARREVDLVDLARAHGTLHNEILTKGRILFQEDATVFGMEISRMLREQEDDMRMARGMLEERLSVWRK